MHARRSSAKAGILLLLSVLAATTAIAVTRPSRDHTKPTVRTHGARKPGEIVVNQKTNTNGVRNSVSFSIDLGEVFSDRADAEVKNAPEGFHFNKLKWTNLIEDKLPPGVGLSVVGVAGGAEIPALVLTIAIPENATTISSFVRDVTSKSLTDVNLLPRRTRVNDSTYERVFGASYLKGSHGLSSIGTPQTFRTLRTVSLTIPLANVMSGGKSLSALKRFTAGIEFTADPTKTLAGERRSDPLFANVNRTLVANAGDLTHFQLPIRINRRASLGKRGILEANPKTFDSTITGWIDPNAPYVKLSIHQTGIYRVRAQDIIDSTRGSSSSGFDPNSVWRASTVRLINKGKEVPIVVDSTPQGAIDAITFYGERQPGFPGEYFNVQTDTNCYWLTSFSPNKTPPLRYTPKDVPGDPLNSIVSVRDTLHHERDSDYYGGDQVFDEATTIHRTEWINGERFVWKFLNPPSGSALVGDSLIDTFFITKLPLDATTQAARLRMFVRGVSVDAHQCQVLINGQPFPPVLFSGTDSVLVSEAFQLSSLHEGPNTIQIQALKAGNIDRFYLDWFEIAYRGPLVPSTDRSIAQGQWLFNLDRLQAEPFKLPLEASQQPILLNLTDTTLPQSAGGNGNIFTFKDATFSFPARYAAATASSLLKVDKIYKWNTDATSNWSILSKSNGVDYLVITHPDFLEEATRLAARKQSPSFRTKVVTTDEVYNAFGYGSNEPDAIRQFLHYGYDYYAGNPVGLVTLLGDATYDPKFNLPTTSHRTFIPAYGIPVSDFWYTMIEATGIDSLSPQMVITRIPVEQESEAKNFLDKILEYENKGPQAWNRDALFVIGGLLINNVGQNEHAAFSREVLSYLKDIPAGGLLLPPLNMDSTIIRRQDFSGGTSPDFTRQGAIQSAFRAGQSMVWFAGHGATFITDVYFGEPAVYRNKGLYPVLITLSCRTGAFAENNEVALNERFLRVSDGGAVMTYGTTGFGSPDYDDFMSQRIFSLLRWNARDPADTRTLNNTNLAQIFTLSKLFATDSSGAFGQSSVNAKRQYSILGDAAMDYTFRAQPEFNVRSSELAAQNSGGIAKNVFSIEDSSFTIVAPIHNFGYSAEKEVHVLIEDRAKNITRSIIDTLLRLDTLATVTATFSIDTQFVGEHTITVTVDQNDQFAEFNEGDNVATFNVLVNGKSVTPFYPPEGARSFCDVSKSSVRFVVLTPLGKAKPGDRIEIEVDTSSRFDSPLHLDSLVGSSFFSEFNISGSQVPNSFSSVLWWRTRLKSVSGESTDWQQASFSVDHSTRSEFSYTTAEQLAPTVISALKLSPAGALQIPSLDTARFEISSFPPNDRESSVLLNQRNIYSFYTPVGGIAVITLTNSGSNIESVDEFLTPPDNLDSQRALVTEFTNVIKAIPAGRKVFVITNHNPYSQYFPFDTNVTAALQSLGSAKGFAGMGFYSAYMLIGIKGSAIGSAHELLSGQSIIMFDTVVAPGSQGRALTPFTSVSRAYHDLKWKGLLPTGADITFSIIGQGPTGKESIVKTLSAASGQTLDISDINPHNFDRLAVQMDFSRTDQAAASPELSSIELEYDPAPEFTIEQGKLTVQPDTVEEGNPVVARFTIRNLTCTDAVNVPAILTRSYHGTIDTLLHTLIPAIGSYQSISLTDTIGTSGYIGRVDLTAIVNPGSQQTEQLAFNNNATASFYIGRDTLRPNLDLLVDGRHIVDGDYVSDRPEFSILLFDRSPVRQLDTASIAGLLTRDDVQGNPEVIAATGNGSANFDVRFTTNSSGALQATLIARSKEPLKAGHYTIMATARDASGNPADTIRESFVISAVNGIEHVMNYPNPFKEKTDFTFVLKSGGSSEVKVVIYTVAGRKIRTLTSNETHRAGLNTISWDGKDDAGNEIANGTYLYRVVMAGQNQDGSEAHQAITERAVKSR